MTLQPLGVNPPTPMVPAIQPPVLQRVVNDAMGVDIPRPNLLRNGGFEQWSHGPGPFSTDQQECADGWLVYANRNGETGIAEQIPSTAPAGSAHAVKLTGTSDQANLLAQYLDPSVCALNGMTVSLSFLALGPVGAQLNGVIGIVGQVGFSLTQPIACTGDWQTIQLSADIPQGSPQAVTVVLAGIGKYVFNFDNVSLVVGSIPSNYQPVLATAGPVGPQGAQGTRGTLWTVGNGPPPSSIPNSQPGDMYLDSSSGDVWQVPVVMALSVDALSSGQPVRTAPTAGVRSLTA